MSGATDAGAVTTLSLTPWPGDGVAISGELPTEGSGLPGTPASGDHLPQRGGDHFGASLGNVADTTSNDALVGIPGENSGAGFGASLSYVHAFPT